MKIVACLLVLVGTVAAEEIQIATDSGVVTVDDTAFDYKVYCGFCTGLAIRTKDHSYVWCRPNATFDLPNKQVVKFEQGQNKFTAQLLAIKKNGWTLWLADAPDGIQPNGIGFLGIGEEEMDAQLPRDVKASDVRRFVKTVESKLR